MHYNLLFTRKGLSGLEQQKKRKLEISTVVYQGLHWERCQLWEVLSFSALVRLVSDSH